MVEQAVLTVSGIDVQVVRKDIKNLHLGVYPPDGRVRVAAPQHVSDDNVRLAVVSRLAWIKKQQREFQAQPRQSERQYVSGECHYFLGRRYRLEVVEQNSPMQVELCRSDTLIMRVRPGSPLERKQRLLNDWYRAQLKARLPDLLSKWQPLVGVNANGWDIRQMKTRWGSCAIERGHIRLNLELAKKPLACLEYILVHELIHLHERHHNERFKAHLQRVMPDWRERRDLLNRSPLAHEDWVY